LMYTCTGVYVSPKRDIDTLLAHVTAYHSRRDTIFKPSSDFMCVTFTVKSWDLTYELLPALRDASDPSVLYVPYGEAQPNAYQVVFPAELNNRIKSMDDAMPGIRNCIRIFKVMRSLLGWKIESFAFTCALWHSFSSVQVRTLSRRDCVYLRYLCLRRSRGPILRGKHPV
jgi:hypothetical protein